jgi:hypothetical protein
MKLLRQGKTMKRRKLVLAAVIVLLLLLFCPAAAEDSGVEVKVMGFGWLQAGMIMKHTDSVFYNYNGDWLQSAATQVTALVKINEHWDGALGIGGGQYHRNQSKNVKRARDVNMTFAAYITQARFTWTLGDQEPKRLKWHFGYFPFRYNPDVKNLGMYLLRGTVYPGIVESGFEVPATLEIANIQGTHMQYKYGPFTQDLLVFAEINYQPLYDFSIASVSSLKLGQAFNFGFGVNFYHALPLYPELTSPGKGDVFTESTEFPVTHPYDREWSYIDTLTQDTTWLNNAGTKLVGFFSFDAKPLLGWEDRMSPEDMKIYGEVGVIGVKDYVGVYDNISERIPVMVGINFPTFGILDNLTLELESYKAPYRMDLNQQRNRFSPVPRSDQQIKGAPVYDPADTANVARLDVNKDKSWDEGETMEYDFINFNNLHSDDFKWSLHFAKTIKKHVRFSAQIACDHFKPDGLEGWNSMTYMQIFSEPSDWYWMTKVLYFF